MKRLTTLLVICLLQTAAFTQTIQDAKKAIEAEYYYKAKMILLKLNKALPTAETNYYLGNVYLLIDNMDSAKYYYQQTAAFDDSKNALVYVAAGKLNLLNNNTTEAKENFDYAIKMSKSKNAEVFYQIGDAYYKRNNAEAIKNYETAYGLDPGFIINLLALGDAYLDAQDPGKALTKYQLAISTNPNIAISHLREARVYILWGKHKDAIASLEKTVELDPNIAVAWKELGEEYYRDHQYDKVRKCYEKYLELNSEDIESRIVPCVSAYQIGDYEYAIDCSKSIVAVEPNNFVAYRIIAYSYKNLADSARKLDPKADVTDKITAGYEAIQNFWNISDKKLIPMDYIFSAKLASESKDTAKAMFYYSMAIENDSTNADMLSEYGKYLYFSKKYTEAINIFQQRISKFSGGPLDYFYLGRAYYQIDSFVAADSAFAQFVYTQPNSPDGYLWRAKSNTRIDTIANNFQGLAAPYYEKFIPIAETDIVRNKKTLLTAYSYMAVFFNSKKDDTKACEFVGKAKALDPLSDDVKFLEANGLTCKNE